MSRKGSIPCWIWVEVWVGGWVDNGGKGKATWALCVGRQVRDDGGVVQAGARAWSDAWVVVWGWGGGWMHRPQCSEGGHAMMNDWTGRETPHGWQTLPAPSRHRDGARQAWARPAGMVGAWGWGGQGHRKAQGTRRMDQSIDEGPASGVLRACLSPFVLCPPF